MDFYSMIVPVELYLNNIIYNVSFAKFRNIALYIKKTVVYILVYI